MQEGHLEQNKVHLEKNEYKTVKFLLDQGYDISLIPPSQIKGMTTPDIMINNRPWEIKVPLSNGKYTIKNALQKASHQSENVIIDLRWCKMDDNKAVKEILHHYYRSKRIRKLIVITKNEEMLDFSK